MATDTAYADDATARSHDDGLPPPFHQFVLKVHSRCNLACDYCYLYQGPDSTWRDHPARVSGAVMRRTAARIAEHLERHRMRSARIDLHGGEPLLGGPGTAVEYAAAVRRAAPADCELRFFVQTNGTLLTPHALAELAAAGIRVGLSLDGGSAALNRRRTDHAGRPSWPAASRAARLLARSPEQYAGILCTIDLAQDPLAVYDSLAALAPPTLDLLLPHANWATPPPGVPDPGRPARAARATPYADWLAPVFDRWWERGRSAGPDGGTGPRIRLFEEVVALLLGAPSAVESLGGAPAAAVVVETDGSVEQVDSLRFTRHGGAATGCDVFRHGFDAVRGSLGPGPRPAADCLRCPVGRVCGGGNPAHRYEPRTGLRNPSVYCADLEALIRHIGAALASCRSGEAGELPAANSRSPSVK
ncbi:radical SAM protein [Streptomyces sp. ODS28]|uniref:radical SAM protein n=1 Tax=Streptomyces sp. ODS28 TaxID=3136688 RepID=UPI0031E9105C